MTITISSRLDDTLARISRKSGVTDWVAHYDNEVEGVSCIDEDRAWRLSDSFEQEIEGSTYIRGNINLDLTKLLAQSSFVMTR